MKAFIKQTAIVILTVFLLCCKKEKQAEPAQASVNNTSWLVTITVTGNTTTQNIFEFSNGGSFFWHPGAAASYNGAWTQNGTTVSFVFKEDIAAGGYFWDNTGTLSSDGTTFTGTMQRRGAQASGTFTAKKL